MNIQDEVRDRVRLDAANDVQKVKDWINQAYADVAAETEAIQDYATMATAAGSAVYTLDPTISRIKQMYITQSGNGQSRPLVPTSLEALLEWSASNGASDTNAGGVTHYSQFGLQRLYLYPTPTRVETITVFYTRLPTALSNAGDVPELQEPYVTECLVNGACFKAALFLKDPDAQLYKQLYEEAKGRLRGHLRRKQGAMTQQFRLTRGDRITPHDRSVDVRW